MVTDMHQGHGMIKGSLRPQIRMILLLFANGGWGDHFRSKNDLPSILCVLFWEVFFGFLEEKKVENIARGTTEPWVDTS